MSHSPPPDFDFSFDPSLSSLFPNPPPLPSSADLFSPQETTDLFGFFDSFSWDFGAIAADDFDPDLQKYEHIPPSSVPYSNPHLDTLPEPSASSRSKSACHAPIRGTDPAFDFDPHATSSESSSATTPTLSSTSTLVDPTSRQAQPRIKPLLSTPQKRLNHIMSEQKRRNAIRDGYAQLIALMAPAGSAPGIGMPTRGRPKGSGTRGKGQSKGKSGVLFRAVEYCRWLEEGRASLQEEVNRVETAAGL